MISTGPANDLKVATRLARDMVMRFGMSDKLGPRTFGEHDELVFLGREIHEERDYSDKTAEEIDKEIRGLVEEALSRAKNMLSEKVGKLEEIVKVLLEKETLEQDEIKEILGEK